jgi:signal transduction histidine kinase/FixJ family two-component response regulator
MSAEGIAGKEFPVIKLAQYLSGLTAQQDVWSETGQALVGFFSADLVAVSERSPEGRHPHSWAFSDRVSHQPLTGPELAEAIAEVFESGFLGTRLFEDPSPLSVVFVPISQDAVISAVMVVGYAGSEPLPRELLNVYLAVSGLVGTTASRLASTRELRLHREHLEELVSKRTAENAALEHQLQRAQKLEAVGRLAGGVAHDFNNMLGAILGHLELVMDQVAPELPIHEDLVEIRKAAQRSADLTRQLLAFAREQTAARQVLDLNTTVDGMLKMLQRFLGEHIVLAWAPAAAVWPIHVDPSQIDQILANLCINARDAISGTGTLRIETANVEIDEPASAATPGSAPGDYIRLVVADDGCGMSQETLARIFEPFFTTKELGTGTGLGLATVYGIIQQNHGFVEVRSEPGRGTTFAVHLPRYTGAPDEDPRRVRAPPASPPAHGTETILLVEDEPAILRMTTRLLEQQGFEVLSAGAPAEAIRRAKEHPGAIDLLMTDVVMPEMNGRELGNTLLATRPGLKRLYMSGYTADIIAHHGVLDEGVHFLQKPFSRAEAAAKVRAALDAQSVGETRQERCPGTADGRSRVSPPIA